MSNPNTQPNHQHNAPQGSENIVSRAIKEDRIIFNGLRNLLTEYRIGRAERTVEKMDHKDALYEHAGKLSLEGRSDVTENIGGEDVTPIARTWPERMKRKRIEKRGFEAGIKQIREKKTNQAFGGDKSKTWGLAFRMRQFKALRELSKDGSLSYEERLARRSMIKAGTFGNDKLSRNNEQIRTWYSSANGNMRAEFSAKEPWTYSWRDFRRNRAQRRADKLPGVIEKRNQRILRIHRSIRR